MLGSRYVAGGKVVNWPRHRELISRGGNLYARLALGVSIHDITGGYRAYQAEVLRTLELDEVASHGYCFQVDLAWRTVQAGFTVVEVPITFTEREIGESKMSGGIVREALWQGHPVGHPAPLGPGRGPVRPAADPAVCAPTQKGASLSVETPFARSCGSGSRLRRRP